MKNILTFFAYALLCCITACQLQKDLDIVLPAAPKQLMVEAYLIPGDSVKLLLTETADYLDSLHLPMVNNARVIIKGNTVTDTLISHISFNDKDESVTNYLSKIVPDSSGEYGLLIESNDGRTIKAKTTILPVVPIDTIEVHFNEQGKANITARFYDAPNTSNFYRVIFFTGNKFHSDVLLDDKVTNGAYMAAHTGYNYKVTDYLQIRLFHLTETHYKFLKSLESAEKANSNNPFAQPVRIVSGVEGGIGIFTGLSYHEKDITIQ